MAGLQQTNKGIISGLILGSRPANERRRYNVMLFLIGWAYSGLVIPWYCVYIGSGNGLLPDGRSETNNK